MAIEIQFIRKMESPKDIDELLAEGERLTVECKKARNSLPNSVWETYSSFANTCGGTILLGIEENENESDRMRRFTITGVENAEKIRKDLWNIVNNKEKVSANILNDSDIRTIAYNGKDIVAINVPRAEYGERPVYINNNLMRGTFRRNHEGDYHCSEQMIRMMVRDAYDDGNDRLFLDNYSMDDIDIPTLERYRILFRTENPEHIWNELENKEFLRQLGCFVLNRETREEGLTMAGLLMFGKGLSVRERFDNLRMDYVDKSGLIGEQRYSDRLTYDGTWENNLFNFIRMVIPRLTRELPRPFKMEGIVRKDDTPQHKAVREAFTNMVIHADFMIDGLLRVEKYDDRFVLTNPGLLKLPLARIYAGGESKSRNQRIQNMLRMIGYGENLGSGFPLILKAWNERHWLEPELIEQPELMQVSLILHIVAGGSVTKDVTKDVTKELSQRQRIVLGLMMDDGSITIPEMAKRVNVAERTIKRDIEVMLTRGYLRREGGRKDGIWVVIKPIK